MEIKVTGKTGVLQTDPHKVPDELIRKYPEAHWRFVGITNKQIRKRLDQGYIFVPSSEVKSFQGKRIGRQSLELGLPEDVFVVGDTVLMVCHKKDAEGRKQVIDDTVKGMTQGVKQKMLENVKDLDGRLGVIGEGVTKKKSDEKELEVLQKEADLAKREEEILMKEKEIRVKEEAIAKEIAEKEAKKNPKPEEVKEKTV